MPWSSKKYLIAAILLWSAGTVTGQRDATAFKALVNADSVKYSKLSGDDKQTFWGILGTIGTFSSESGNTISLQPSLYTLATLFSNKVSEDSRYAKEGFIRNFQLNLGVIPSSNTILKVDSAQFGFTYAIKNNKVLEKTDYDNLLAAATAKHFLDVFGYLNSCLSERAYEPYYATIRVIIRKSTITKDDLKGLPPAILHGFENTFHAPTADSLLGMVAQAYNTPDDLFNQAVKNLPMRNTYTVSVNSTYDFVHNQWAEFDLSPLNWYAYLFGRTPNKPALNVSLTYKIAEDTTLKKQNLSRELGTASAGINFVIPNPKTKSALIEIKPAADLQWIQMGQYSSESTWTVKPSITLRVDITKDFSIPITIKYDKSHPKNNLFGFLSLQYAFAKKGS